MKSKLIAFAAASTIASTLAAAGPVFARDEVKVAGSTTVLPYARIVAEALMNVDAKFKVTVEPGGSSTGIADFCKGVGPEFIDVANASRFIKKEEIEACKAAGVKEIVEVHFGYEGVVFASDVNGPELKFTQKDWFLALAAEVPVEGKLAANPNKTWKQVSAALPEWEISAYIPSEGRGTREVLEEKVLIAGCKETGAEKLFEQRAKAEGKSDKDAKKAAESACKKVRKDDNGKHAVDVDSGYGPILNRLANDKQGVGVFGLAFYDSNSDKLRAASVNGVAPSVETVGSGAYQVARPLVFYVKKAHIASVPGLKEYAELFVTERMIGTDGPLSIYGLVPLSKAQADKLRKAVADLKPM